MSSAVASSSPSGSKKGGRTTTSPSPWRKKKQKQEKDFPGLRSLNGKWGYLFVAPFVVMFLIFGMFPVIYSTIIAFYNYDPLAGAGGLSLDGQPFVGLENFTNLLQDDRLYTAIGNTFDIWFWSTFPQLVLSIGLAAVLRNRFLRAKTFWRTILLVPNITSVLAVAIIFGQLFGREFGMINMVLGWFGVDNIDFVEDSFASHIAIATMITWRWAGYNALIFLASMLAIPDELYESASLDGATAWQQFLYVTLPGLRNTITFVLIVGTIGGLQVFAEPLVLAGTTDGGSTHQLLTLTMFLYDQAFGGAGKWGYGAAIGIVITFIVLIVSLVNFLVSRRLVGGDEK
jgi:cellobiose transport system permease protein